MKLGRDKKWIIVDAVVFIAILILLVSIFYIYEATYIEKNGYSLVKDAVFDMTDSVLTPNASPLDGDWEVFYNKWIVTDGEEDAEPDFILDMSDRWTGRELNGEKLPSTGYASYRIKVENYPYDGLLSGGFTYPHSFRLFIDGVEVSRVGEMSRTEVKGSTFPNEEVGFYNAEKGSSFYVVLELSYTDKGGVTRGFYLVKDPSTGFFRSGWMFGNFNFYILFAACIFMIIILIFSIFWRKEKGSAGILTSAIALIIIYFVSEELVFTLSSMFGIIIKNLEYYVFLGTGVAVAIFISGPVKEKTIKMPLPQIIFHVVAYIISFLLLWLLKAYSFRNISVYIAFLSFLPVVYRLAEGYHYDKMVEAYYISSIGILVSTFMELVNLVGGFTFGTEGVGMLIAIPTLFFNVLALMVMIRKNYNRALRLAESENKLSELKDYAYRKRVDKDFMRNTLVAVEGAYSVAPSDGDSLLEAFARHLRYNVDSEYVTEKTFYEELDNAETWAIIEKSKGKDVELLYDLDFTDFRVPILSIQPLVEALTGKDESATVQIKSYIAEKACIVEIISDLNPVDLSPDSGYTINNTRERIEPQGWTLVDESSSDGIVLRLIRHRLDEDNNSGR